MPRRQVAHLHQIIRGGRRAGNARIHGNPGNGRGTTEPVRPVSSHHNLISQEVENIYGTRVRSRMREMFNLVDFSQETGDKR